MRSTTALMTAPCPVMWRSSAYMVISHSAKSSRRCRTITGASFDSSSCCPPPSAILLPSAQPNLCLGRGTVLGSSEVPGRLSTLGVLCRRPAGGTILGALLEPLAIEMKESGSTIVLLRTSLKRDGSIRDHSLGISTSEATALTCGSFGSRGSRRQHQDTNASTETTTSTVTSTLTTWFLGSLASSPLSSRSTVPTTSLARAAHICDASTSK